MNKFNENFDIVHKYMDESLTKKIILDAINITQKGYHHQEIFEILASDNDFEKPIAILNIVKLETPDEASLLINHLTGQDGRIREMTALKLLELLGTENSAVAFFENEKSINIFLNGILDINPNVARNIIEILEKNNKISYLMLPKLILKSKELIGSIETFLDEIPYKENKFKNRKNHAKNKKIFNLYWCLEALSAIKLQNDVSLLNILTKCSDFYDYTIREKTAKILSKMENPPLELLSKLKNDENFYVKNQF